MAQKFKDTQDKDMQTAINEADMLTKDIKGVFKLALNNDNTRDCLWNLRVVNSMLVELKQNTDSMIDHMNYIKLWNR